MLARERGFEPLLRAIQADLGVAPGETTADGKLALLTARCLGTCGLAPAAVVDGQVVGRLRAVELLGRLHELVGSAREAVAP